MIVLFSRVVKYTDVHLELKPKHCQINGLKSVSAINEKVYFLNSLLKLHLCFIQIECISSSFLNEKLRISSLKSSIVCVSNQRQKEESAEELSSRDYFERISNIHVRFNLSSLISFIVSRD